ncbi:protein ROLLING AND ERECT LEAF 2-like [Magnolia sinica]|uniref:protein ROLLING AND ERECT LEAF 2-like n=1 Tax=Magnolia sinica TaxID=86752 RepID=UPI002658BD4E|nr:protein ROLLING AND ERECT LEAF 2-like [Magnolia sinica]
MGCSSSKLEDEEPVQLCKDRRKFIKQAVEYRIHFATGHAAYIQSLRRVSLALQTYVEGDEHREFLSDPYTTPSFTPVKKTAPEIVTIPIPLKSLPATPVQSHTRSSHVVNYLRSGGNPSVSVEERPQSPETVRVESYSSPAQHFGIDGFFAMQSSPMNSSSFYSSPHNRAVIPPPSPQTSQWDFFWNPFSSLDRYGYPTRTSFDQMIIDDEVSELRQVREEEGIPDLEEEDEDDFEFAVGEKREEQANVDSSCDCEDSFPEDGAETDVETDSEHETKVFKSQTTERSEVSEARNAVELEVGNGEQVAVSDRAAASEETPGFTAYVNRRPTSMAEVVTELENQFTIVCDSAKEVSTMLEASKAQYATTGNELTAIKMLNPVALFRSASSRSTSSRFFHASSSSRDMDGYESSSDVSEDSCMFSGSHQTTLDRLYAWEKKLYEEVKSGERIRMAYEKKCKQLRGQDVKGEDPSSLDKTRAAIRDLHTRIKVSIHSVESVSKRIETLRDEELQPQLMELIQGLAKMWRVMAECHRSQKRTIDAAKLLLAGTPPKHPDVSGDLEPSRLARAAASLESELRNWRACFESWIAYQRSYVRALTGWAMRCARSEPEPEPDPDTDTPKPPLSPRRSSGTPPPIFGICVQWSRFLDTIREAPVIDGLDFFAAGVGSVYGREEAAKRSKRSGVGFSADSEGKMEIVEVEREEEATAVKTADLAVRVLCAGMGVAVSSLTEFAVTSAEGYEELVKQWEKDTWAQVRVGV